MKKKYRVVGMMMAKNDEKVLPYTLKRLCDCCDAVVVLDDGSTDNSVQIIESFPKVTQLIRHKSGRKFNHQLNNEKLIAAVAKLEPEWGILIDPDDLIEQRFIDDRDQLFSSKDVGQYKFKEISLWGGKTHYRIDNPQWYMRETSYTPFIFRWNSNIRLTIAHNLNWKSRLLKVLSNNLLLGLIKKTMPIHKSAFSKNTILKEIFFPTDYMNHTNFRIIGMEGKTIQLEYKKIHYHFFNWEYAAKKHVNYALQAAIRQNRKIEEIPEIVEWVTRRLSEDGLQLEPVKEEWGVL